MWLLTGDWGPGTGDALDLLGTGAAVAPAPDSELGTGVAGLGGTPLLFLGTSLLWLLTGDWGPRTGDDSDSPPWFGTWNLELEPPFHLTLERFSYWSLPCLPISSASPTSWA